MKTHFWNTLAISTTLLCAATAASAQAHESSAPSAPLTRAEVKAELLRARAAGELPSSADVYGPALTQAMSTPPNVRHQTAHAVKTANAAASQATGAVAHDR